MKKQLKQIWKDENGSALVLTMMVFVVLSILGASVGVVTMGSLRLGDNSREYNSAYYIAEAGANIAYDEMLDKISDIYEGSADQSFYYDAVTNKMNEFDETYGESYFARQFGAQPEANVTVRKESDTQYVIESTGKINGKTRTVEKEVNFPWVAKLEPIIVPALPENTVFITKNDVDYQNENQVSIEDNIIEGLDSFDFDPFDKLVEKFPSTPTYEETRSFNNESYLEITENTIFTSKMTIKNDLTIEIGDKDVYILVDDLSVEADIKVEGAGRLFFYTTNTLSFEDGVKVNEKGDLNQVNFIHDGTNSSELIKFGSNGSSDDLSIIIKGSIFIKNAGINNANKTATTINGLVLYDLDDKNEDKSDFYFHTDSIFNAVIIAPTGYIEVHNHSTFNGVIIANKVKMNNHTGAKYASPYENGNLNNIAFGPSPNDPGASTDDLIKTKPAIEQ